MPQLLYVAGRVAVVPVLASFALAYLVNPLVERFETRGLSRTVASIAALLVVGLMGFVFLVFVIPDLWAQVVVAVRSHEPRSRALRLAPAHDTIAPPRRRSRKRTYAYVLRSMRTPALPAGRPGRPADPDRRSPGPPARPQPGDRSPLRPHSPCARGLSYFRIGANSPPSSARALAWRAAPMAGSTSLSSADFTRCFGPGPVW
jgi:hypothetical protein